MRLYKYINETTKPTIDIVRNDLKNSYVGIKKAVNAYVKNKNLKIFVKSMNTLLNDKFIYFKIESENPEEYIARMKTYEDYKIDVWINSNIEAKDYKYHDFVREIEIKLSHEYIHRIQFAKQSINNFSVKTKKNDITDLLGILDYEIGLKKYFSTHEEIEAWAYQMYLYLKVYDDEETFYNLLDFIYNDEKVYNRFLKKIYFYFKNDSKMLSKLKQYLKIYSEQNL